MAEDANVIFGAVVKRDVRDVVKITVIAAGFDRAVAREAVSQSTPQQAIY